MKKIKAFLLLFSIAFVMFSVFYSRLSTSKPDTAVDPVKDIGSYHISQLVNGTNWEEKYVQSYDVIYSTKTFSMTKENDSLTVRIEQETVPNGDIEFVKLTACGQDIEPNYAK